MLLRTAAACLLTLVATTANAVADVRLPGLISDHMLLQRDVPARIFGRADPGEAVSVTFRSQTARTVADALGRWEVWLQPLAPGPAAEMTIRGTNTITIADVLVGDVWVGSGQSNMQWTVGQSDNAAAEIAAAKHPGVRLFYVPRKPSPVPVDDVEARWVVCSPETVGQFSAVLYYFGRALHQDRQVPVGLIHSSWGGTPIASWISGPSLVGNARLEPFLTFWANTLLQYPTNLLRQAQAVKQWEARGSQGARPAAPLGPGHAHEPTSLFNGMIAPLLKYTIGGALWYQGETEAGRAQGHIYGEALMTLVNDWRRAFGQGDFPFYWVQLANYGNAVKNGHWMRVQEGQVQATALRRTGVAVITDIGNPTNIHPTNKQDVGRRLAMLADARGASPVPPVHAGERRDADLVRPRRPRSRRAGRRAVDGFPDRGVRPPVRRRDGPHRRPHRRGIQPRRDGPAVGSLCLGLQPRRESDEHRRAARLTLPDRPERRTPLRRSAGLAFS
jgi:sialate O-acetylesterase